ncbi:MAG: hypothetical protein LBC68_01120 [Prevotellaceae bacterium]|jgi:hypothetical protein|nr:hypothetical protein [Prevotellaceae bacterium]
MEGKNSQSKKPKNEGVNVKDFDATVHMLLELLGRDMESSNPSRDKDMLVSIRDGLFRVEVAGQLFERIKAYRALLIKHFPECAAVEFNKEQHIHLAKESAKLSVQAFTGKMQIQEFLQGFGVNMENTQMAIFAITQFIEMIRQLPLKFFVDPDNRLQIIIAMQRELDELIVLEEATQEEIVEGVND